MQTWKKKLVVSQLALACTLAIASQANAKDISGTTLIQMSDHSMDYGYALGSQMPPCD
jgi:negative regulator of sigma E activity